MIIIDGQQRLTTVTLLLVALAGIVGRGEPFDGYSKAKINHYYLKNTVETDYKKYKLLLSRRDKDTLISLIENKPFPKDCSIRIEENFKFISEWLRKNKNNIVEICKGLSKLQIVEVSLDSRFDNPQLIFESLNSTGLELSQADLIRNYVLMGQTSERQIHLYEHYWKPMEEMFGQEAYNKLFDGFVRHYLIVKTGNIPIIKKVYEAFKDYVKSPGNEDLDKLLEDLRTYSEYYCAMALNLEKDNKLRIVFQDLRELKVDVAYPLLLELYHDYRQNILSKQDFLQAIRLIESYVFRRAVCSIPTNSMNKTFATLSRDFDKEKYLESIKAQFQLLPSYKRFPTDEEFFREIQIRDLYNFRNRSYWLRRFENHNRKEQVIVNEYTVEHILPQNPRLSQEWKEDLGTDWKDIQKTWLHTLGNLSLTGYNTEYSDKSFLQKKMHPKGFQYSPIRLNESLQGLEKWDKEAIKKRAGLLAKNALDVWHAPDLDDETLSNYIREEIPTEYSIENHPNIDEGGSMSDLFYEFRGLVLALDPVVVSEEFLSLYVAYKAETNFVDVVPNKSHLHLQINMPYPEIIDPKGICDDRKGRGRWGNGDVEVKISKFEELPYIIGLIRQSLERQLGNNGDN